MTEEPTQDTDPGTVNLTIKDPHGEDVYFKVKRTAKMRRLFQAYCKKLGVEVSSMRFFYRGEQIDELKTPDDLVLKDGDKIDAFVTQISG